MTVEMAVAAAGAAAKAAREVAVMAAAEEKRAGAKGAVVEAAVNLLVLRILACRRGPSKSRPAKGLARRCRSG